MRLFVTVAACILALATPAAAATAEPQLPEPVEQALRWLPEDTQSLTVTRGPFEMDAMRPSDDRDVDPVPRWIEIRNIFRKVAVGPLVGLADEHPEPFRGRPVEYAVAGSRIFRVPDADEPDVDEPDADEPDPNDEWGFEGGVVAFFGDEAPPVAQALGEEAREPPILEHAVGGFESYGRRWLVTRPRPHVLVVAMDRAFLEAMLRRMAGDRPAPRALPPGLPEWEHVDTAAESWGLRHVGADGTGIHLNNADGEVPDYDPEAIGTAYTYDLDAGVAEFAYLSRGAHTAASAEAVWSIDQAAPFRPSTRAVSPDLAVSRLAAVPGWIDFNPENFTASYALSINLHYWSGFAHYLVPDTRRSD